MLEQFWTSLSLPVQILFVWLVAINVIAFFSFLIDKVKAQSGARRIRERTLWLVTLLGGTPGALASMHLARHKTKKHSFQAVMLLIMLAQIGIIFLFLTNWPNR